jgi:UDP-2,3-diacylglucosamine pyrophosphatase LpxH
MIVDVSEEKIIVISDLHIGNPLFREKNALRKFLEQCGHEGFSVCVAGDGLDVVQTSFKQLAASIPDVFYQFRTLRDRGLRVYYVIGNHDIVLEHLLADWDFLILTPFINLCSGNSRIRIEHGHLYDPAFSKNPAIYHVLTKLAGYVLDVWPGAFDLWTKWERRRHQPKLGEARLAGEPANIALAAREILRRGFDWVIFGHTHHVGFVSLPGGGGYVNAGSWLIRPTFVRIIAGKVELCQFEPSACGKPASLTEAIPIISTSLDIKREVN